MERTKALESRDDYTVGWITALPLEFAAAAAMLDEEHDQPCDFNKPSTDPNTYTWGRIGEHNVVIVSLPAGVYGTTSAATTASSLLASFPQIRVGLMVGIGAGIPRPEQGRDIRLGDIVVSQPSGRSGGVVQYDLQKVKGPGHFERIGNLNAPPQALLTALTKLQGQHERRPSRIPAILEEMLINNPHMAKPKSGKPSFVYQGEQNDRLFKASYEHVEGSNCKKCDSQHEIARDPRDSTEPEIHYGIIASGNRLIEDGSLRDSIVQETGEKCICFEMVAAGLMNTFPCLVIRGICDYADSHKNDQWQRYAAATAAAYAKEFLGVVPREDLKRTQKAIDLLKDISQGITTITNTVEDTKATMDKLHHDHRQFEIIRWLSAPDPLVNQNKALRQRHKGSGLWLLQTEAFRKWEVEPKSFLWLHGTPGCGKTILSSTIIESLSQKISPVDHLLYFYFDFGDIGKQSLVDMIRSLISQLYYRVESTRKEVDLLFSSCKDGHRQPTTESLCGLFLRSIKQCERVWIVLDALDECNTRKGNRTEGLLSWIRDLLDGKLNNVHLLVTSRPEPDIQTVLTEATREEDKIPIQGEAITADIRAYVHMRIRGDGGLNGWKERPEVQQEIETQLVEKSNRMFRWVACQIDALEKCYDYRRLQKALASLPKTLDDTYARLFANGWYTASGPLVVFVTIGIVNLVISLMTILMYIFGKRFRSMVARSSTLNKL